MPLRVVMSHLIVQTVQKQVAKDVLDAYGQHPFVVALLQVVLHSPISQHAPFVVVHGNQQACLWIS